MNDQLTTNAEALRLFFTEDIYLVKGEDSRSTIQGVAAGLTEPVVAGAEIPKIEVPAEKESLAVEKVEMPVAKTFSHLGKNQRQILILVNDLDNPVSTEQGRELLRKIVKAIELTANDFALVNYANCNAASYTELSSYFSCKVMFAFGVPPAHLGLTDFSQNTVVKHESAYLIFSSDLHTLDSDPQGKKTLWSSLKQLTL